MKREAMVLALRGGKPPHFSFLWMLWEEKGVLFLDTSERQSAVGVGDSGLYYLEPSPENYSWTQQQQALSPMLFL